MLTLHTWGYRGTQVIEIADGSLSDRLGREACDNGLLVRWAHETCLAMCYLASRSYIHRDLACRNILLINDSARIADFGRSRQLEAEIYDAKPGIVPIRWTAPEALTHGKYSSASDVWSFGILLYEMWTRGAMPYDGTWSNAEVRIALCNAGAGTSVCRESVHCVSGTCGRAEMRVMMTCRGFQ